MKRIQKPLQTLLIKPAGPDCNMACSYCFYLKKASLYHGSPTHRMSQGVLEKMVRQAMEQSGSQINFIWQGGEPTLMGLEFYQKCVELQQRFGRGQLVGNGLQTNGLLIDDKWIRFLKSYSWLVGLSLDGPQHVHDHYRKSRGGGRTWGKVAASAEKMLAADLAVNALIVVNDYSVQFPDEIYSFHKNLGLSHMQFIPCVETDMNDSSRILDYSVSAEDYGPFLCRLFDLWMDDFSGLEPATSVRLFESLFYTYIGLLSPECTLLDKCGTYVVVEHTGDVYSCDFFVQPEWCLGNVKDTNLLEMLNSEIQCVFGQKKANLPDECKRCRWLYLCKGGCPKDRLPGHVEETPNHLCSAYKMFFEYSDGRFRSLVEKWKKKHSDKQTANQSANGKTGRNQSCPCGSGKKFKMCCGS